MSAAASGADDGSAGSASEPTRRRRSFGGLQGHAADNAAAAVHQGLPKSAPLPPGMQVQDLKSLLKPAPSRHHPRARRSEGAGSAAEGSAKSVACTSECAGASSGPCETGGSSAVGGADPSAASSVETSAGGLGEPPAADAKCSGSEADDAGVAHAEALAAAEPSGPELDRELVAGVGDGSSTLGVSQEGALGAEAPEDEQPEVTAEAADEHLPLGSGTGAPAAPPSADETAAADEEAGACTGPAAAPGTAHGAAALGSSATPPPRSSLMRSCGVRVSRGGHPGRPPADGSPKGSSTRSTEEGSSAGSAGTTGGPASPAGSGRHREAVSPAANAPELEYLWQERTDQEIANELQGVLADASAVKSECDALFVECMGDDMSNGNTLISLEQLHAVTQRLIDRFGSRDPLVLAEIADLYRRVTASCDASRGLGVMEFRGYAVSVLTHIMRELEVRAHKNSHIGDERLGLQEAAGPEDDRSIAQTLSDMLMRAGSSLF